jgi:hypothetical protein
MSEATQTEPTFEQLQQEYAKVAQLYGDLSYRIKCMKDDAEGLVGKMKEFNVKAAELKAKEAPAKPVEGEVVQ